MRGLEYCLAGILALEAVFSELRMPPLIRFLPLGVPGLLQREDLLYRRELKRCRNVVIFVKVLFLR